MKIEPGAGDFPSPELAIYEPGSPLRREWGGVLFDFVNVNM
jgi:hypothetical protein